VIKRFKDFGEEIVISTGVEFAELVRKDYKAFAMVGKEMDVRKK